MSIAHDPMEDSLPLVTIVTPSYNMAEFIEETIKSVLNQSYPHIEYIVADGGSDDGTLDILEKYSDDLTFISGPDNGQTDAINKGLRMAKGEILAYLNADDLYTPTAIEDIVKVFLSNPDIGLVYGDIEHIGKEGDRLNIHKTGEINLKEYISCRFYLPQPSVFFSREVWETTGEFDDSLHLAMDYDYWLRALLHHKPHYLPKVLSKARIYWEAKSSALNHHYLDERLRIFEKVYGDIPGSILQNSIPLSYRKVSESYAYFFASAEYMRFGEYSTGLKYLERAVALHPTILLSSDFIKTNAGTIMRKLGLRKTLYIPD